MKKLAEKTLKNETFMVGENKRFRMNTNQPFDENYGVRFPVAFVFILSKRGGWLFAGLFLLYGKHHQFMFKMSEVYIKIDCFPLKTHKALHLLKFIQTVFI